jgi:2-(1,2-epoxy-1,2-dihydrophenyl)acetyl-CoA isomerase
MNSTLFPVSSPTEAAVADVIIDRSGPIMTVVLDRPRRKNALTVDMIAAITGAVREASLDDVTRVLVIRSSCEDFCSGIDLVESNAPADPDAAPTKPRIGHLQRRLGAGAHDMILTLSSAQVPVVSAVRGWAVGVGNMLALSADVTIATPSARFWVPFVTKGFTPDSGSTWLLPRLVGLARAKEMVLRGRPVDGEQAAEWGLVSSCVPDDELDSATAAVANEFASSATVAVGLARQLLHQNLSATLPTALQNEAIHEELAVRSDDFKEGMRAFAQKRPPEYTGR